MSALAGEDTEGCPSQISRKSVIENISCRLSVKKLILGPNISSREIATNLIVNGEGLVCLENISVE